MDTFEREFKDMTEDIDLNPGELVESLVSGELYEVLGTEGDVALVREEVSGIILIFGKQFLQRVKWN